MNSLILIGFVTSLNFVQALSSRVEADLKAYDEQLATRNAEFGIDAPQPENREWVKRKLRFMFDSDQFMRRFFMDTQLNRGYTDSEKDEFFKEFSPRFFAMDDMNTADLKALLQRYAWFSIGDWGVESDKNAWLITQHADRDPEFQKSVLRVLEVIYPLGETNPRNYAYLFDRVAASWNDLSKRQLQRFGTQGQCVGVGVWEPIPMEEPAKIDERRRPLGLESHADYIRLASDNCR